jgi:hypothetical protein
MSPYFAAAECDDYFFAYPNPSADYVNIDINRDKLNLLDHTSVPECLLTLLDRSGIIKLKTVVKGFPYKIDTDKFPEGIYFLTIVFGNTSSTIQLIIDH